MTKIQKNIFSVFLIITVILLLSSTSTYAADFKWQLSNTVSPLDWAERDIDAEPGTYYDGENLYFIHSTGEASTKTRVNNWKCYKGTSMDNLEEVSVFSADFERPHGDDRYWLSGLWVDEETGVWYTTVHDEFNYVNTNEIAQHERYILYATSTDKGTTWTLQDMIISSDNPLQDSDDSAGRYEGFGCGDQKLFVDSKSGYFYIYYMKAWTDKETGYMFKTYHAARSPISEKMAAGSWQKWYNGEWCEEGVGGHDTALFSPPCTGVYVGYNTYIDKYIAIGVQKESDELFISTCTDMDEQNWSQPEYFASKNYGGWYNWCFDNETMSRNVTGQNFRLYRASHDSLSLRYNEITLDSSAKSSQKQYFSDYSNLKGRIYAHNSIMEMIPDYAYRCDFSSGSANMITVAGSPALSVTGQQKSLQMTSEEESIIIDSEAPDMKTGVFDFCLTIDAKEEFGAIMSYDSDGNYEMLNYKNGVFTWETRDNEPIELFKCRLSYDKAYSFNIKRINCKLTVQIDQNTLFDGEVYECGVKAGKYGFMGRGTLLIDNVSRYDGLQVFIDGAEFAMDYKPEIVGETVMLPMVRMAQIFGMTVKISGDNVTITLGSKTASAALGSKRVKVGSISYTMPEALYMSDGNLMIPAQMLKCIGITASVSLDDKTVNIKSNKLLKVKLQSIEAKEIKQICKAGRNGIADYFEDYKTNYITIGKLMYKNVTDSVTIKRMIYRRYADKTASRIYHINERDIASVELKTLTSGQNVNNHIKCYVSPDGNSWTQLAMTASNMLKDSSNNMYWYDFANKNVNRGYRYLKVEFLAYGSNWSGQVGYVIINGDMAEIDKSEQEISPPQYIQGDLNLPLTTSNGAVVEWTMPENPYIASDGKIKTMPTLGDGLQKINISANITYRETTDKRIFTLLLAEPSGNIVNGFTKNGVGTAIKEIQAEQDIGWSSQYSIVRGDADSAKVVSTPYGNMLSLVSDGTQNGSNYEVSRKLSRKMDFDCDKTYYIVWNQRMDGYGSTVGRNQTLAFTGASVNGKAAELTAISAIRTQLTSSNISNNAFDKDYFPVYMQLKFGSVSNYPTVSKFSFVKGQMYTMVMRIDAVGEGKDRVYMKAYPTGTTAPLDWMAKIECEITGCADGVALYGMNDLPSSVVQYGNLQIQSIAEGDKSAYAAAEAAIKAGKKILASELLNGLGDGAWKTVICDELAAIKDISIGTITFKQNEVRISRLLDRGPIEVSTRVTNNTENARTGCMIAALYDNDELKDVSISAVIEINGSASEKFTLTVDNNVDLSNDAYIKVFFADNDKTVVPIASATVMDRKILVQKTAY